MNVPRGSRPRTVNLFTWVVVVPLFLSSSVGAFDHITTHRNITRRAVLASTLDVTLRVQLGMSDGITTNLKGQFGLLARTETRQEAIIDWLRYGAQFEDEGTCHATQHFHNPMKSFTESGVSDLHFGALLWWIPPPLPPAPPISPDQLVRVAMRPWCLSQIRQYLPGVTAIHSAVRWGTRYTDPTTKGAVPGREEG